MVAMGTPTTSIATTTTKNFLISIMGHENYKLEAYEKEMFLSISFMMSRSSKYKIWL